MPYSLIIALRVLAHVAPRATSARAHANGGRSKRRNAMFSATDISGTQALRSGSSGRQRTMLRAHVGPARAVRLATHVDEPGARQPLARQHLDQLLLAVARNPGDPHDLARAHASTTAR